MIKKFEQYNESLRDEMVGVSIEDIKKKMEGLDMESQLRYLKNNKIPSDEVFTDEEFEKFLKDYVVAYNADEIEHNNTVHYYNLPKKYYKIPTIDNIKFARNELGFADFLKYMKILGVDLYDIDYLDFDMVLKTLEETNK